MTTAIICAIIAALATIFSAFMALRNAQLERERQTQLALTDGAASVQVKRLEVSSTTEGRLWERITALEVALWEEQEHGRRCDHERNALEARLIVAESMCAIPERSPRKPLVLLAENDPETLKILVFGLKSDSFDVHFVVDGAHALELHQSLWDKFHRRYNAIVLDVAMTGIDGLQVAKAIRERGDLTPIAFFTGCEPAMVKPCADELGITDIWYKPLMMDELKRRVMELMEL